MKPLHSLLITLLCASMCFAEVDANKLAAIPAKMKEFIAANEISGAVTLVATKDKVIHLASAGKADLGAGTGMATDSIFWIASMTKPITGVAVMMMQEEGKLDINDDVAKHLPEFKDLKGADGKPASITIKQLLTHSSGLGEAPGELVKAAKLLADVVPAYAKAPLKFAPGSKWSYCNSGINTLARIVEVTSGKTFPQFLDERLFKPLGMKDTTFYLAKEQLPRLAKSYKKNGDKLEEAAIFFLNGHAPDMNQRYPAAAGGLFSTAPDYARFGQMMLNEGALDGKTYLKPQTVKMISTIQSGDLVTGFTPGNGWGLGFCVVKEPQGVTAMLSPGTHGHGGAYGTQAWIDPGHGVVLILMVQRSNFPNADASEVRKAFQQSAVGK